MSSAFILILNMYTQYQPKSTEFQLIRSNAKDSPRIIQSDNYSESKKLLSAWKQVLIVRKEKIYVDWCVANNNGGGILKNV